MCYRINLKQDPIAEGSESVPKPKYLLHQEKFKKKKREGSTTATEVVLASQRECHAFYI